MTTYYFDTSIWLDFFENRNEPNLPKGEWAARLMGQIVKNDGKIVYSDAILTELGTADYSSFEIEELFKPFRPLLMFIPATMKQPGKAKDLAAKRNIPKMDAPHALIARDANAILITLDHDFKELVDITKPHRPNEFI